VCGYGWGRAEGSSRARPCTAHWPLLPLRDSMPCAPTSSEPVHSTWPVPLPLHSSLPCAPPYGRCPNLSCATGVPPPPALSPVCHVPLCFLQAVVRLLLAYGAHPGEQALWCAVARQHDSLVKLLMDQGARINSIAHTRMSCQCDAMVQVLTDRGACMGWNAACMSVYGLAP